MDLEPNHPSAIALTKAIREGQVKTLNHLLAENPQLARARIVEPCGSRGGGDVSRSLLHIATDWPGHFPSGVETVTLLIAAGTDVNAQFGGSHNETPLHWAASSDDVAVLDALLDQGANIEARGAVIGGGTALSDAVAFGQWKAARRLIERGAQANLWEGAALGLLEKVEAHFATEPAPEPREVTNAFWCACHGGQLGTAKYLQQQGADLNWVGHDRLTPLGAAQRSRADEVVVWLQEQGAAGSPVEGRHA